MDLQEHGSSSQTHFINWPHCIKQRGDGLPSLGISLKTILVICPDPCSKSQRGINFLLLLWAIQCIQNHREDEWILWACLKELAYSQKQIKCPLKKLWLLLLKLYLQQEREEWSHKWDSDVWDNSSVLVDCFGQALIPPLSHSGLSPVRAS